MRTLFKVGTFQMYSAGAPKTVYYALLTGRFLLISTVRNLDSSLTSIPSTLSESLFCIPPYATMASHFSMFPPF